MDSEYIMDDGIVGEIIDLTWLCINKPLYDLVIHTVDYNILDFTAAFLEQKIDDILRDIVIDMSNLLWTSPKEYEWK